MITFTKEQLIARINQVTAINKYRIGRDPAADGLAMDNELFAIALASLEAEPVAYIRSAHNPDGFCFADGIHPTHRHQRLPLSTLQDGCYWKVTPLYAAPPAPVSVPDEMTMQKALSAIDQLSWQECTRDAYMLGWNACRAAMLQGAEPVTTANKLPFEQWLSQQTGTIDVECGCVMTEVFFHWLRVAYEAGNSPVIPDGWVACSERMPSAGDQVLAYRPDAPESNDPLIKMATYVGGSAHGHGFDCYCKPTHWMPLPAAPQQEVKS